RGFLLDNVVGDFPVATTCFPWSFTRDTRADPRGRRTHRTHVHLLSQESFRALHGHRPGSHLSVRNPRTPCTWGSKSRHPRTILTKPCNRTPHGCPYRRCGTRWEHSSARTAW